MRLFNTKRKLIVSDRILINFLVGTFLIALPALAIDYNLLAPIKDVKSVGGENIFGQYMASFIPFVLAFAAVAAVTQIVIGGFEYALSEAITNKQEAKDRISSALSGLLLALASFLILNTINPKLTSLQLTVPPLDNVSNSENTLPSINDPVSASDIITCGNLGGGVCRTDLTATDCISRGGSIYSQTQEYPCLNSLPSPPFTCSEYVPNNPNRCASTGPGRHWVAYVCPGGNCDDFSLTTKSQYNQTSMEFGSQAECEAFATNTYPEGIKWGCIQEIRS